MQIYQVGFIIYRSDPHPLFSSKLNFVAKCLTVAVDHTEEDEVEVEVEEDTQMGTILMAAAAVTTPVATPTGMTTYGLEIVVKLDAFRNLEK